jgi:hypothetical protein
MAVPAWAESETWYLPGAAETYGLNGARFSSTLFVNNRDSTNATVQISLIPYEGKVPPGIVSRSLGPGETLRIPAVLQTLFGLSSDAGTLVLTSENDLGLWLATANVANPAGTYGVAVEPYNSRTIIPAGSTGHAIWVNQGNDYRTNIALTLLDPGTEVRLTFFDQEGQPLQTATVSSGVPISWQTNMSQFLGVLPLGRVEVYVLKGRAGAYTAVVDNVTNDSIAVMAEMAPTGPADLLLDGVVRSPGVNGTYWSTNIRLFNPSSTAQEVTISGLGFSCGNATLTKTVSALGLIELTNILGNEGFSCNEGTAGGIRLQANGPLLVAGETNNSDPSGTRPGTFSAFQRTSSYAQGFLSAGEKGDFIGIEQASGSTGFRTNLAFLSGANGANATLLLCDRLGTQQASVSLSLPVSAWIQKNVSAWFPGATVGSDSRVEAEVASGSLDGYGSRIDNGTGDAVVLPLAPIMTRSKVPQIAGCEIFPSDNPWNLDISGYPVDPNSANYIAHMNGNSKFLHADFGSHLEWGIPYVVVSGTQPKVPMTFDYADESDPGPYPIPPDAPIEGGVSSTGDRHVLVLDKDHSRLYETYNSHYVGPGWHCGSGAIFDLTSNKLRPDYWTSADAAGLPILPGLVRYDEAVIQKEINHAFRFTVQSTQQAFIHPATHYASSDSDANAPPMGLRVRLKANYDISRFSGAARVILVALKKYGMILADNGSDWFITGATDSRWSDDDLNQLKTVPGNAFEVVQTGPLIK